MGMYQSGKWNDLKCATKRPFFCQKTKKAAPKPIAPKSIKKAVKKHTHHAFTARVAAKKALLEATHSHMKAQHELAHAKKVKNVSHKHYHAMKDAAADAHKVLMKADAEYSHCKGEAKTWWKREFFAKEVLRKA